MHCVALNNEQQAENPRVEGYINQMAMVPAWQTIHYRFHNYAYFRNFANIPRKVGIQQQKFLYPEENIFDIL